MLVLLVALSFDGNHVFPTAQLEAATHNARTTDEAELAVNHLYWDAGYIEERSEVDITGSQLVLRVTEGGQFHVGKIKLVNLPGGAASALALHTGAVFNLSAVGADADRLRKLRPVGFVVPATEWAPGSHDIDITYEWQAK